jgi:hypothetical protein
MLLHRRKHPIDFLLLCGGQHKWGGFILIAASTPSLPSLSSEQTHFSHRHPRIVFNPRCETCLMQGSVQGLVQRLGGLRKDNAGPQHTWLDDIVFTTDQPRLNGGRLRLLRTGLPGRHGRLNAPL